MFSSLSGRWQALGFALLILALFMGNPILLGGAIYVLLVVLAGASLQAPSRITVARVAPRTVCWSGDTLEIERRVEIGGGIGPLYVHDRLPGEAEVVGGNNFRVVWKWPGARSFDLSYRISFPKRGVYTVGETAWEAEAPVGWRQQVSGQAGPPLEFYVAPRTQAIRRVNQIRGRAHSRSPQEDAAVLGTSTNDFTDLRPYIPGDPMRWINWKSSARSSGSANPLLVNKYDPEGRKSIWIFLDGADYMEVGTTLSALIDNAVEAAGSIAQYYLARGYTLGAYVYNSNADILTPELGQKQFRRLTNMLTGFEAGPANQNLLQAVEWCKGFLVRLKPEVFIITRLDVNYSRGGTESAYADEFLAGIRRLVAFRPRSRRHNQIRVVHMEPQGFHTPVTALEEQALGLMRWEAQPMYGALHRSGATVLPWNPQQQEFASTLMRHLNVGR